MKISKRSELILSIALIAILSTSGCNFQSKSNFILQPGDLLFQDLDGSPLCDAIEKVTRGYRGANFTHIGIVALNSDEQLVVLEAVSKGVTTTTLDKFLNRSHDANGNPKVLVGRLKKKYRHLIDTALREAFTREGKPYDDVFNIENDAYYCSELVYECFRIANSGKPLLILEPMTFKDPGTNMTFPAWQEYFSELNALIPEGAPGLNPGSISRSPVLRIVHMYGIPDGFNVK
ncbi:MAG: hypothetical protein M0R44_07300 [Candidatus Marinimicrobia bacterium]|jgi:hypothetical protein|nr:hypothetical protein [Candidatus Neomarinimicrobiota bacterium]